MDERLTALPRLLRAAGLSPPPYPRLRELAVDAVIPAKLIGGTWHFDRNDLATIAETLKLTPPPRLGRPPKNRAA